MIILSHFELIVDVGRSFEEQIGPRNASSANTAEIPPFALVSLPFGLFISPIDVRDHRRTFFFDFCRNERWAHGKG